MGNTKLNFDNIFLFLFLILFPFGQIIRIGIIQPLDIIVGLAAVYSVVYKLEKPKIFKYFENFLIIAGFSWIFGAAIFKQLEVFYGLLYFARIAAYFYFLIYAWNFAKKSRGNKNLLIDALTALAVVSAVFGWIQYFMFPNFTPFIVWGWDDHLFRLVGTFLDPTFLGMILVFGLLSSIYRYLVSHDKWTILTTIFLLVSLAFTYSRASYLAFLSGLLVIGLAQKKMRQIVYLILALVCLIIVLPTSGNKILKITREFSAIARIENYVETLKIYQTSPIFGIGYDNLCLAKAKTVGYMDFKSHACSGSDSSLLFILTTTGMAGIIVFVYLVWNVGKSLMKKPGAVILASSFAALLTHSLFSNSLVYPWILGWIIILTAVVLGREV